MEKLAELKKADLQPEAQDMPDHVLNGIDKSLQQFEEGKSISLEVFYDKHL